MTTTMYGASDDLIEFDGDVDGEVGCFGTDSCDQGVLVCFSDGTLAEVKYGKDDKAIWGIRLIEKGDLYRSLDLCVDPDADPYSDQLHLADGIKWAYACKSDWERVS